LEYPTTITTPAWPLERFAESRPRIDVFALYREGLLVEGASATLQMGDGGSICATQTGLCPSDDDDWHASMPHCCHEARAPLANNSSRGPGEQARSEFFQKPVIAAAAGFIPIDRPVLKLTSIPPSLP
jgi:hypothetical protein